MSYRTFHTHRTYSQLFEKKEQCWTTRDVHEQTQCGHTQSIQIPGLHMGLGHITTVTAKVASRMGRRRMGWKRKFKVKGSLGSIKGSRGSVNGFKGSIKEKRESIKEKRESIKGKRGRSRGNGVNQGGNGVNQGEEGSTEVKRGQ